MKDFIIWHPMSSFMRLHILCFSLTWWPGVLGLTALVHGFMTLCAQWDAVCWTSILKDSQSYIENKIITLGLYFTLLQKSSHTPVFWNLDSILIKQIQISSTYVLGNILGSGGKEEENMVSVPQRNHKLLRTIEIFVTNCNTKQDEICLKSNL